MNELIKIGNHEITTKKFKGQRVVTFKDIDMVHERVDGTAGRNFRENKERFIEDDDFFFVKPSEIQNNEIRRTEINNAGTYLITEQGYLMLVKSFTDELAWKVQRDLVNAYFKKDNLLDGITAELQAIIFHDKKLQLIVSHIEKSDKKISEVNKDLQDFKLDMPLLGLETDKITSAVRTKGVNSLGGKNSNAYQNKSLRGKIYSDIYSQLKREFDVYSYKAIKRNQADLAVDVVLNYKLPFTLQQQVEEENSQMTMGVN